VCVVYIKTFWLDVTYSQQAIAQEQLLTLKIFGLSPWPQSISFFSP